MSWKNSMGVDPSQPLSQMETKQLEETLGIAPFLLDNACQRFSSPYVPQIDGWRTGLILYVITLASFLMYNDFIRLQCFCIGMIVLS